MTEQLYFINAKSGVHIPEGGALSLIHAKMQSYDRCLATMTTLEDICLTLNKIAENYAAIHPKGRKIHVKLLTGEDAYIRASRVTYHCLSVNENLG